MKRFTDSQRAAERRASTSLRTCIEVPGGGCVVTMGFPGLTIGAGGHPGADPERLAATLDHPALADCGLLVVLVEEAELPEGAFDGLRMAAAARDLPLAHLPIRDYGVPGQEFAEQWQVVAPQVEALLAEGRTLGLSCHYGAGRSGTIAASLLIDRGLSLGEAILALREQFPDSIETEGQMAWLDARARAGGAPA
ncbi:protein-tyrosine phosphatase family protein [Pseudooceanicola sp. 502str34]